MICCVCDFEAIYVVHELGIMSQEACCIYVDHARVCVFQTYSKANTHALT